MKQLHKILTLSIILLVSVTSCKKDALNLTPVNDKTATDVYATPAGYKNSLVKLYASFGLTGFYGGSGASDIGGLDAGFADFLRLILDVTGINY